MFPLRIIIIRARVAKENWFTVDRTEEKSRIRIAFYARGSRREEEEEEERERELVHIIRASLYTDRRPELIRRT